uniref:Uncharacterized protein n=1 Tax=Arundo donax TaxID=35708 RepID=A0A0A8XXU8_ARUDO
MLWVSSLQA